MATSLPGRADPATYAPAVEYKVLGPLEVLENGDRLDLGGPKQRVVLALLIANAGRQVSMGTLTEGVYGDDVPERAHRSIHTFVSNLRSVAGEVIERRGDGYAFTADRDQVDSLRFEDLVKGSEKAGDLDEARDRLRTALEVWRGHPYADVEAHTMLEPEMTRLSELRVSAIEARVDADLELGRDRELIAELETLTTEHPLNEHLRSQQMLALYRAGRQGDALRACDKTRAQLLDMGLEPSPELRALEQRILDQDPSLMLDLRPTVRRATVLVADVAAPDQLTALSPDERHRLISAQSAAIDHAVEDEGGRVFAQRGSAVYARFDSTSSAARAATSAQRATAEWVPRLRIAIATGDIEEASGDELSGPPISRAAALVAVGHGGQVLISSEAEAALISSGRPGFRFRSLGSHPIPGLDEGELVYQLDVDGEPQDFPALRLGDLPPPLPISERGLTGYELRAEIGGGSSGTTHRAYQPSMGREVAVKAIRADLANQPGFIRQFEVDAQLVARLEHPAIVPLLDYWREPDGAFLVMRLMRGGSLTDRFEEDLLSLDELDSLVQSLGSALDYAHRRGVAHGSVTPDNVFYDEQGNIALGDFAVGRTIDDSGSAPETDVRQLAQLIDRAAADTTPFDEFISTATAEPGFSSASALIEAWVEARGATRESAGFTVSRNPYKGLRAFGEPDAKDFYGRTDEVRQLLATLRTRPLVAVVGPSGIGKSSIVRAGLIPAVRRGSLGGANPWLVTDMIPGRYPYEELASALLRVASTPAPALEDELRQDWRGLVKAVKRYLPESSSLLLVVDQFEELFALVDDEEERASFLELLQTAVTDERCDIRVVFTMRADFFDRPLRYGEFGDLLRDATVPIAVPTTNSMRQIVEQPALGEGVRFEAGLVDRIVTDVADQSGALPLLEFSLTELFDERHSDELTSTLYEDTGGVLGALSRRAESIFQGLTPAEQTAARQVFLRLVNVDEAGRDTRRRTRRSELTRLGIDRQVVAAVLSAFGRHRLLTFDRDPITRGPTVEVAHEAILAEWPQLVDWIDDQREDLVLRRRLSTAVDDWEASDRSDAYLLAGGRLAQHLTWSADTRLGLTSPEQAFLEASRHAEEDRLARRQRRRRSVTAGFALAAVVSAVLAFAAWVQRGDAQDNAALADDLRVQAEQARDEAHESERLAEERRVLAEDAQGEAQDNATLAEENEAVAVRQAQLAKSRELAASSIAVLNDDPVLAVLLGVAAFALDPDDAPPSEQVSAAYAAIAGNRLIASFPMRVDAIDIRPDGGGWVVAGGRSVTSFVAGSKDRRWEFDLEDSIDRIGSLSVSPDGQRIALGVSDHQLTTAESAGDEYGGLDLLVDPSTQGMGDDKPARLVILSAQGVPLQEVPVERICTTSSDAIGETGGTLVVPPDAWSHDGELLAVQASCLVAADRVADRTVVFDTNSWAPVQEIDLSMRAGFARRSGFFWAIRGPEAEEVMTVYETDEFRIVGEHAFEFGGISADGATVVGQRRISTDFALEARATATGELRNIGRGLDDTVSDLRLAEDSSWVIAAGSQRTLVWDYSTGATVLDLPTGSIRTLAFDEESGVLYGNTSSSLLLWDLSGDPGWLTAENDERWFNSDSISVSGDVAVSFVYTIDEEDTPLRTVFPSFDRTTGGFLEREVDGAAGMPAPITGGRFAYMRYRGEERTGEIGPLVVWDPADGSITEIAGCWSQLSDDMEPTSPVCRDGSPRTVLPVSISGSSAVVSSADGSVMAGLTHEGVLMLWDSETLELKDTFDLTTRLEHLELGGYQESPNSARPLWHLKHYDHDLVTLGAWPGLIVVHASTGEILYEEIWDPENPTQGHPRGARATARAADGSFLIFPDFNGDVYRLDYDGFRLTKLTGLADGRIRGLAISPDQRQIALTSTDGFVRIVDVQSGALFRKIPLENGSDAFWNSNESLTVTRPGQGTATFSIDLDTVVDAAITGLTRGFTSDECAIYGLEPCPITAADVRNLWLDR